ncbi:hypothetical protein HY992_03230 [Candidatus Micrarchaeota archaeon]|nr:hypothetical protein [Candidatus Micrarchaeota archaeon]
MNCFASKLLSLLGWDNKIAQKISEKYGQRPALFWNLSTVSGIASVCSFLGIFLALLLFIPTNMLHLNVHSILSTLALFLLIASAFLFFLFELLTAIAAFSMGDGVQGGMILIGIPLVLLVSATFSFYYRQSKEEELKK